MVECHKFDDYFDQQLQELDQSSAQNDAIQPEEATISGNLGTEPPIAPGLTYRGRTINGAQDATSPEITPVVSPITSRPATPGGSNLVVGKTGPPGKASRRARKALNQTSAPPASSGDEHAGKKKAKGKAGRKWDADGLADEDDDRQLDYSAQSNTAADPDMGAKGRSSAIDPVDASTWGSTSKGKFVLKDLGDEVHSMLAGAKADKAAAAAAQAKGGLLGSGVNAISGLFRNVVGGKTLTRDDLDKAMKGMEEHLLKKNVALEAALRLCEGVEKELVGVKTGSFESKSTLPNTSAAAC